jgi:hypothetical protein
VDRIGLAEAIAALRAELTAALEQAEGEQLTFPVEGIQLELHVGVTQDASGHGGVRFWVVELGAGAGLVREQIQRVTVTLGPPQSDGESVAVQDRVDIRP